MRCTHFLEYYLALFCGLRPGEILGLKYEDYDAAARILYINKQYSKDDLLSSEKRSANESTYSFKPLRTEEERILRVPDYIVWALKNGSYKITSISNLIQRRSGMFLPECPGKDQSSAYTQYSFKKDCRSRKPAIYSYEIASYLGQTKLSYTLGLCCQILEAASAEEGDYDEKTE